MHCSTTSTLRSLLNHRYDQSFVFKDVPQVQLSKNLLSGVVLGIILNILFSAYKNECILGKTIARRGDIVFF